MTVKELLAYLIGVKTLSLIVLFLAPYIITYSGFFPYKEKLVTYHLPSQITAFANFDGIQYLIIAQEQYYQYNQAYFPLYPLSIRYFTPFLGGNHLIAGILISNISFFLGLLLLRSFLMTLFDNKQVFWTILFLLLFPTSFFFSVIYTEGLFFLLLCAVLYSHLKRKFFITMFSSYCISLTRVIGVFTVGYFWLYDLFSFHMTAKKKSIFGYVTAIKPVTLGNSFFALFGFASYAYYLQRTTGDPFFFFTSQPAFGANRSTEIILFPQVLFRYLKIFLFSDFSFQYMIAVLECASFLGGAGIMLWLYWKVVKDKDKSEKHVVLLSLTVFSLLILLVPTLTGTFSSIPRYVLFSLSVFIGLSYIRSWYAKVVVASSFFVLQMILLAYFVQGYFIS